MSNLPRVAYLTLCYMPILFYYKPLHVLHDSYPNERKMHLLMYQRSNLTNEFPIKIEHDLPFPLIQRNVEGKWPALWAFKMRKGIDVAIDKGADYIVIYDEDDVYPPWWTVKTLKTIYDTYEDAGTVNADGCWNYHNRDIKRGTIKVGRYDAPGGTLVAKPKIMKVAIDNLFKEFPLGQRRPGTPGTMDLTFCKRLRKMGKIVEHTELRGYGRTKFANTNRRHPADDIDFDFDYTKVTHKEPKRAKGPNAPSAIAVPVDKKGNKITRRKKL